MHTIVLRHTAPTHHKHASYSTCTTLNQQQFKRSPLNQHTKIHFF